MRFNFRRVSNFLHHFLDFGIFVEEVLLLVEIVADLQRKFWVFNRVKFAHMQVTRKN